ncbi:MAG: hypothetical protein GKR90_25215 [Pseudomonadales bacterium]|nr:hypothetical protein [Pseudomonadales bacterium]
MAENDDLREDRLQAEALQEIPSIPEIVLPEPEILAPERLYLWPSHLPKSRIGDFSGHSKLLRITTRLIQKLYPSSTWIPIVKTAPQAKNPIAEISELVEPLERLFRDELKSSYSDSQRKLLEEADCVLIGVDRTTNSIMAYCSTRYAPKGSVPGVSCQITAGGHLVVSSAYHANDLGPFLASAASLYGYSLPSFFRNSIVVLRSNNKYIERVFRRAEPIYRSDSLTGLEKSAPVDEIVAAIDWVHHHVFHLTEDLFGHPLRIDHRFERDLTLEGLKENEIVYLARTSSMFYFLAKVFLRIFRRKLVR